MCIRDSLQPVLQTSHNPNLLNPMYELLITTIKNRVEMKNR
jgi:hypothetical protein